MAGAGGLAGATAIVTGAGAGIEAAGATALTVKEPQA